MLNLRVSSIILAGLAAVALAGCDSEKVTEAQGVDAAAEPLAGQPVENFEGETIPAVTLTHPDGSTLALAETRGTPVLLNLWATWCAPCVVEMPQLDELAGELEGKVRVITVSEDLRGAEVVEPFFAEHDFAHLPQWMDPENALAASFGGGPSLPLTVLYDAQGREVWRVIGAYDWSSAEAREKILAAVAG